MSKMLDQFCDYLSRQVNRAMYIIGGQHTRITRESDIDRYETGINRTNAKKTYRRIVKETGNPIVFAYDCSGLGMYWLYNVTHIATGDKTANGMYAQCEKISENRVSKGCWVFKCYTTGSKKGRAHHIGYVIGMKDNNPIIVSAKGRAYGVVTGEKGWNAFGVPSWFADEIKLVFVIRRVLKKGSKGEDVKYLQKILNERYDYKLTEDGIFGKATLAAVKQTQRRFNLEDDGQVGKKTASYLGIRYGGKL